MSDTANFNIMVDALKEMYPNLSSQSAIDLTWGGLQETQAYNALSQSDKNRIIQTNTDYKNGSNGATCQ
ncbi:hypothetical protein D3C72_2425940 [compost metagenome]